MIKIIKLFFSRFFIIAMAIILQVLLFVAANVWLSNYITWINLIFILIAIVVFFVIINRNIPDNFKMPYLVALLIMPILGVTLFFTFGNVSLSRKNRKKLSKVQEELKEFCHQNDSTMERLKAKNHLMYGNAKYIENTSLLPTYDKCYVEYLPIGEVFFEKIVEELKKAKKYILMEYFIIEKGEMFNTIYEILKQKARDGVEVYFMYDDVGSISKVPNDFIYDMRNDGIFACKFAPFKAIVSPAHNNRDHRKITVIDGEVGFIGGINLADEYINKVHPYGKWKDNAILVKGKCVDSLIWMFVQLFNPNSIKKIDVAKMLVTNHKEYDNDGFISIYGDGPRPMYEDYIGENVYLNIINQAKNYLYIMTPYLIVDYSFISALCSASKRGVKIKILTPHIADKKIIKIMTKSSYSDLIKNGVEIYEYEPGFVHAKTFVCDDKIATIGTINLDYRSLVHHFECGAWIYHDKVVLDIKDDFEKIIEKEAIFMDSKKAELNIIEKMVKDILRLIAPLM